MPTLTRIPTVQLTRGTVVVFADMEDTVIDVELPEAPGVVCKVNVNRSIRMIDGSRKMCRTFFYAGIESDQLVLTESIG